MRKARNIDSDEMTNKQAWEVALVGILPSWIKHEIGKRFKMAGQPFIVTGYATKEEFIKAFNEQKFDDMNIKSFPNLDNLYFIRISTD